MAVSQNLDALKDPLQIVRNLSEESGISTEGKVDSSSKLEEEINMTVGQVLSATKSQNEIDSKIQTFLQQSTKARESVAVCEKIENDLDSMEAEAEASHSFPAKVKKILLLLSFNLTINH